VRPPELTAESAQTQELIDLCLGLAEQPQGLAELEEKARIRLDDMQGAEDGFFAGVDAQGAEFYQELRAQIDKVEEQFRAYGEALEQILDGGFAPLEVARALAAASRGLRVAMSAYEEAFLSRGDSSYPVINLFRNIFQGVAEGRIRAALLPATCERYSRFYQSAIEEIEQSEFHQSPGLAERKDALRTVQRCIGELRELEQGQDYEPILARMAAAHADLDAAFDTYERHEFAEGPSQAANVNRLVRAAQGVLEGTYKPPVLESMAQSLLDLTQQNLAEMKNLGRNKLDSQVGEELERMVEALEDIEDALTLLLDYSQGTVNEVAEVQDAIDDLIDSGDALVESSRIVTEAHERAGKVTCLQCQTVQDRASRTCARCGAVLPRPVDEGLEANAHSTFQLLEGDAAGSDGEEVMTDVMHALFQACEAFMAGRLPLQDLRAHVLRNTQSVEQALARLDRLQTPAVPSEVSPAEQETARNFIDLAEDALILLSQGAAECQDGLSTIAQAAEADDLETLRKGMRRYYEGTQKMWQVRRLERQFEEYLSPLLQTE
jgi:hypothetical protein